MPDAVDASLAVAVGMLKGRRDAALVDVDYLLAVLETSNKRTGKGLPQDDVLLAVDVALLGPGSLPYEAKVELDELT